MLFASVVLPTPGTSTISTCPFAITLASNNSIAKSSPNQCRARALVSLLQ